MRTKASLVKPWNDSPESCLFFKNRGSESFVEIDMPMSSLPRLHCYQEPSEPQLLPNCLHLSDPTSFFDLTRSVGNACAFSGPGSPSASTPYSTVLATQSVQPIIFSPINCHCDPQTSHATAAHPAPPPPFEPPSPFAWRAGASWPAAAAAADPFHADWPFW